MTTQDKILQVKVEGLQDYSFYTASGSATISGSIRNQWGDTIRSGISFTVTTTEQSFVTLIGSAIPAEAVAFDCYVAVNTVKLGFNGNNDGTVNSRTTLTFDLTIGSWSLGRGISEDSTANLSWYKFIADTVTGTVGGFFVDAAMQRVGTAFNYTFTNTASSVNLTTMAGSANGSAIPVNAVGFVFNSGLDLRYDLVGPYSPTTTLDSAKSNFPRIAIGDNLAIGVKPDISDNLVEKFTLDSSGRITTTNDALDNTNNVMRVAEICAVGTLVSGQNLNTLTGTGVLKRLILTNTSSAVVVTANIYDNTSAAGSRLMPTVVLPVNSTQTWELNVPYALGVFLSFSASATCFGMGYSQAVS